MRGLWNPMGAAPDKPLPPEVVDLDAFRVQSRDQAGGIVH